MLQTPAAQAVARVVSVDGQSYELREFVGDAPKRGIYVEGNEVNDNALPQAFLVTQPPNSVTRPHFHETNQFQVFVSGSGRFGKKPAQPLTVQFAGGHTPYGPILAGERGLKYFTLRQRWDPGAKYMPQMRERLERGRQRQKLASAGDLADEATLRAAAHPDMVWLMGPDDDGLAAMLWTLGAEQSVTLPDASEGGGQYHVVVNGALHGAAIDGASQAPLLPLWSCSFVFPEDGQTVLHADAHGAQVLVLRFPRLHPAGA